MRNEGERPRIPAAPEGGTPAQREEQAYFRQSFRFSQGQPNLQYKMIEWHRQFGYLDLFSLPKDVPAHMDIQLPRTHAELDANNPREPQLQRSYERFTQIMAQPKQESFDQGKFLDELTSLLLYSEKKYQLLGRQARSQPAAGISVSPDSQNDPYASQLRRYVIEGVATHTKAFDDLFSVLGAHLQPDLEVVQHASDEMRLTGRQESLYDIRKKWERAHPGHAFVTEEALAALTERRHDAAAEMLGPEPNILLTNETIEDSQKDRPRYNDGPTQEKTK